MLCLVLAALCVKAQAQLAFPFQGGKQVMLDYFKNTIKVGPEISGKAATGVVIFKFTADQQGAIKKIIVYYADDLLLTRPLIDAIKQSDHKWIIPDKETLHDFILPFSIAFNTPTVSNDNAQKSLFNYYANRKPVMSFDQIPLDMATLLPTITVNYDVTN